MKKNVSFFLIIALLFGCKKKEVEDLKKPLTSITYGFETNLENWVTLGGNGERNEEEDIVVSSDTMAEGNFSGRFTVSPSSIVSGGNRAELTFDQNAIQGDETWCEYSFYIPTDYQDVPLLDNDGKVNWQVLGQWHHQPVTADGEDWNNYTGQNASPPIAIYYNYFDTNDLDFKAALNNPEINSVYGFDPNWHAVSTISLVYNGKTIAIKKIDKGQWIKLKFNINWSECSDGSLEAWVNNTNFTNGKVTGKNMLNRTSHYFKFGLYRNSTIPHTNQLYYDDIRMWYN